MGEHNMHIHLDSSLSTFNNNIQHSSNVERGTPRVILCAKLVTVALAALAYHSVALLVKALPATINLLIGKLPASLSWKKVFNDHGIPLAFASKTLVMAPVLAWKNPNSYQTCKLGLFPSNNVKSVEAPLEMKISELAVANDKAPKKKLKAKKTAETVHPVRAHLNKHAMKYLAASAGISITAAVTLALSNFQMDQIAHFIPQECCQSKNSEALRACCKAVASPYLDAPFFKKLVYCWL